MFAVIFEAEPDPAHRDDYFTMAAALRAGLDGIDGFLSIERFESLSRPGHLLSLSFWRDEAAVARWRTQEAHRAAQARGRAGVLLGYRLRVAEVVRDYGMHERAEAPPDALLAHGTGRPGEGK
jgi:heme-degrading monooxygenase HmoA